MTRPLRIFVSAGDTSGDQHAAALVNELRRRRPDARFEGFGGRALAAAGVELIEPLADHPIMGFAQVVPALRRFVGLLSDCDRRFARDPPDVVVPVDYPGFNVRLARLARRRAIKVCYHVCPQYWAWAPWRARRLARAVDLGLVTLPFEPAFFARFGLATRFVGHPLADRLADVAPARDGFAEAVGLLPGSRAREIESNLPLQLAAANELVRRVDARPRFVAAHPDPARRERIAALARAAGVALDVSDEPLSTLLARCRFAFVTSGTATLETALLRVPAVVVYRISRFMRVARPFALLAPHVALPNLLIGREVFPEFVTSGDASVAMADAAAPLFAPGDARLRCLMELDELRHRLLQRGTAERAAAAVLELANGADP